MGLRRALGNALVEKTRQDVAKLDQRLKNAKPLTGREKRQARRTIANAERLITAARKAGSFSPDVQLLAQMGVANLKVRLNNHS